MRSIGVGSAFGGGVDRGVDVGVGGRLTGSVARGTGVGVGVGPGTVLTLRGRFWVLAVPTKSEQTRENTAKLKASVSAILRLFKQLIQIPIQTPIDIRYSILTAIRTIEFNPSRVRLRATLPQSGDAMKDVQGS
jgi:hypothetical protein